MATFREDILYRYLCHAPLPLAIERSIESHLYRCRRFERPVLDLGCGDGLFARLVFASPLDTGIDPDANEIERARRNRHYRELICTTGDSIPKPDGSYKTILSNSVLEHIPDLRPVLAEMHRLLDSDGDFYFTVPSQHFERYTLVSTCLKALGFQAMNRSYHRFYNRFWKHYHCYALEGWTRLAEEAGFRVVESFTYNPYRTCLVNDILTPLAWPGVLTKRRKGRWVVSPDVRALGLKPLYPLLRRLVAQSGPCNNGGLVFMALRKS